MHTLPKKNPQYRREKEFDRFYIPEGIAERALADGS